MTQCGTMFARRKRKIEIVVRVRNYARSRRHTARDPRERSQKPSLLEGRSYLHPLMKIVATRITRKLMGYRCKYKLSVNCSKFHTYRYAANVATYSGGVWFSRSRAMAKFRGCRGALLSLYLKYRHNTRNFCPRASYVSYAVCILFRL